MRSLRPGLATLAVGGLVVVSIGVRFVVAQRLAVPWIAPDEMLYGLLGTSLWANGTLTIRGAASPYYSLLTPALIGAGVAGRGFVNGLATAQFLQVSAMSSTAIPVYLWARRLATPWWGVGAAAIAVSGPALTYSGLLMTEPLFYAACTWAAYAAAVALERPTLERQGIFLLAVTVASSVRMQAIVLLPAFALAAWLYARAAPGQRRFRPLAPLVLGIAATTAVAALVRLVAPTALGSRDVLGAYATLGQSGSVSVGLVQALVGHLAATVLIACVIPAIATGLLVIELLRRRVDAPEIQAFAAVAAAFLAALVAQVAVFAADRLDHVSQRYLIAALPVLAVGLAGWVGAGAPRRLPAIGLVGAIAIGAVAFVDPGDLVSHTALYDAFSTTVVLRLQEHDLPVRIVLVSLTALGVVLIAWTRRSRLGLLAAVTIAAMIATSVDAAVVVTRLSAGEERDALGGIERNWLDLNAPGGVTLLVTGDRPWTAEARTVFWNSSVREVLDATDSRAALPPTPTHVVIDPLTGGVSTVDGKPVERELVAAPRTVMLAGDEVAVMPVGSAASPPLVLWRAAKPLRVTTRVAGMLPNGDFGGRMTVTVPGCVPGALEVTFIAKSGDPIRVAVNGIPIRVLTIPAEETPTVSIPSPGAMDGTTPCEFAFETKGYAGTTRVDYVEAGG